MQQECRGGLNRIKGLLATHWGGASARPRAAQLRHLAVEPAWLWLRYRPESELSRWYMRHFGTSGPRLRRIGIVALARKLMVAIWRYLDTGVALAGAQLKAPTAALAHAA